MTTLTENLGRQESRTARMRRVADPTDTIRLIRKLPPVPAPRPRHPGGDRDTRRGAVTTVPRQRVRLTPRGFGLLLGLVIVASAILGRVMAGAFFEIIALLEGWL